MIAILTRRRFHGLTLIALAVALGITATASYANGSSTPQSNCEANGGVWAGGGQSIGSACHYYPGSQVHSLATCESSEIAVYVLLVIDPVYWVFDSCAPLPASSTLAPARGIHCGPVDLPNRITPASATVIQFKGSAQTNSAALVVPDIDTVFPVLGLSFDWESMTWHGEIDTVHLPAGSYQNVRLVLQGKGGESKTCNVGGLTVTN